MDKIKKMNALKQLVEFNLANSYIDHYIYDQETVDLLKKNNPELINANLTDEQIEELWMDYSTHFYCASYLNYDSFSQKDFKKEVILAENYKPTYYCDDFYKWMKK